ncbi:TetR/AcrR family transcriptional regulator [Leptolinea tardivitalis]|uniref:TetR/AcrR family transcriptional regulator n=1 Tax=Leptolinea tardivitalis TaxID=229920 RepID=UPI000782C1A2|nr:TetR/AcrR family transcriptional regulator [Leptolinea tardivitalis]GAP21391.1 transcriptional regulator, TetR family [Leptolinea tardivitalis]
MPRSSREKSALTRSRIIDVAYQLFIDNGYNATPMREISQKAGVTVGAIYNHFETKEDIWVAVIRERHPYHDILPLMDTVKGDSIADIVRSAARLLVQELLNRPDLFNLMFIELVEFKAVHVPDLYEAILPHLISLQDIFAGKKGRLRNFPPAVLLRSFVGLFFSYYITGVLLKNLPSVASSEAVLDQFVDLYLNGILENSGDLSDNPV